MPFVDVAVPLGIRKTFAYSVPPQFAPKAAVGARVLVPFGRQLLTGFVVGCSNERPAGDFSIRAIRDVLDPEPVLSPALVETALWLADYYFSPPGEVCRALLPAGIDVTGSLRICLSARARALLEGGLRPQGLERQQELILDILHRGGPMSAGELSQRSGLRASSEWVQSLVLAGLVEAEEWLRRARVGAREQLAIRALPGSTQASSRLTPAQERLYVTLQRNETAVFLQDALRTAACGSSVARSLASRGLAEILPLRMERVPLDLTDSAPSKALQLTESQGRALASLKETLLAGQATRCLLHGVTGSGKTEIYLRLIAEVLKLGSSAILLVPEIGLTPLLCRIVLAHFPNQVSLLHSGMSDGERFDQWQRIRAGHSPVVVGTRSAVFAPLQNLKLAIIDEEQDSSYKQDESPCYHAREVAWHRIRQSRGVLLMGTATPSIETYYAAREMEAIRYFCLPQRIESRPLPQVEVVDMSLEFQRRGKRTVLSQRLQQELRDCLARGEQAIVLLNRRGYSRTLLCRSCGHIFHCPDCSVSMTYHQGEGRLMCHYCGREEETPSVCASCGGPYIYFVGVGTEQLEGIVHELLSSARLARVDRDTARRRGALRKVLLDFSARKLDVLVGTQMLAKGHDFPDVTLVGVIAADAGLSFPDFRSAERTFQLLTQVAGRAGRGASPGRVIVQSYYPTHYALEAARRQEYAAFFDQEIEFRKQLGYPPFRNMIQILVTDADAGKAYRIADHIAGAVKFCRECSQAAPNMRILGPAAAPIEKLKGKYRVQLLIKMPAEESAIPVLRAAFDRLSSQKVPLKGVHVDVDPLSLL